MLPGRIVSVTRHPDGPRVVVFGQRVHHGAAAVLAAAALAASRRTALVPIALAVAAHDAADWRWWFARGDAQAVAEQTSSIQPHKG